MYIDYIYLENFRNYNNLKLKLNKSTNIFIGDNAQGKTNILESIYYCSIGKSHRTNKDKELIKWDKSDCKIKINVCNNRLNKNIQVRISNDGKKYININSIKINKISQLVGNLNVVMFSPEDLKIVKESPSYRRKFLNIELCKLSKKYYYNLVQYNKVLNERNSLLKKWNKNYNEMVDIYDNQLANFGGYVIKERYKYIKQLNEKSNIIHKDITSGLEKVDFKYITCINNIKNPNLDFYENLKKNRKHDFEKKTTSIGPHKDDFLININSRDSRKFASQGQQRTLVLTIKFTALEIIKEITGEYPVLLLDDVLSELDDNRQKYILKSIDNIQTIITCTGFKNIENYINDKTMVYKVYSGLVKNLVDYLCKEE
ncbi:DNA replication and repair protein RecF [Clostridium acetireducens DSM 10703]|uniref:DNA replication and repair protein RecF n=1 Tax=Clostridium acetireducens DSM 10703 TaxID=1121290 RepID=A0A1E8EXB0_9CLOT|nr:DNA replication/repair protein RecF [Clostridium acetireducens]OFI05404.1 DNA replication and repair protein RecF [Clostridium acetireducens DSM 10703]